jgi:SpoVK/Ycf46/Vps4 family AAA+-type ATPase
MDKELINLIKANTKIIQIISYETLRIHGMLVEAAQKLNHPLFIWDRVEGLKKWDNERVNFSEEDPEMRTPSAVLDFFTEQEHCILLLEDFHPNLVEHEPENIKRLRNIALRNGRDKTLVLSQPFRQLPAELEKEIHIMELPYPGAADIEAIYRKVCGDYNVPCTDEPDHDLIESALGLTIMEAEKAFSLAFIESGKAEALRELSGEEVPLVIREKENVIKKSGYLEYFHPKEEMKDVGGLDVLKDWLGKRGRAFDKGAADFGLTYPRGILLLGIPGTGKSLTAKAVGNLWHFPLLRLDMGKIFGGIVGESEKNIRGALNIAEAIAPSILWIDEIEKGMSGIASSGSTDGGTTSRVLGTFLTWMQEKSKPVFVVATANNISQLPPELLRKGRVDEIFFVDLPTQKERDEIIRIHLSKKKRRVDNFDIEKLAQKSKGFSGAELEEVVKEALFQAYDEEHELRDEDIMAAMDKTFPLSRTMHEIIDEMRKWAKARAVAASAEKPEALEGTEEDVPKLKQESYNNPFIKH